jgi:hypothetical protein
MHNKPRDVDHYAFRDLTGNRFGNLTVMWMSNQRIGGKIGWWCKCDCGTPCIVTGDHLMRGTKSCGCLRKLGYHTTHGRSKRPEWRVWEHLRQRCYNSADKSYPDYGGRGIAVCEAWQFFENFYSDMGPRPSLRHSIDRVDNDGPYSPENCRWATRTEQARNRRSNRLVTVYGQTKTAAEWIELYGLNPWRFYGRLNRGWSAEKALEYGIK